MDDGSTMLADRDIEPLEILASKQTKPVLQAEHSHLERQSSILA
jgi:hypothetical protein